MGLESGSFINDLVTTNPLGTDTKSQGDDHIRLLKTVIKASFPNSTKAYYIPTSAAKTGNYTVLSSEQNKEFTGDTSGGGFTFTLPSLAAGDAGFAVAFIKITSDTNAMTVAPASGTINGAASINTTVQYQRITAIWSGTTWYAAFSASNSFVSQLLAPNGSVGAPAYAFTNDPDCGWYRIGANNLGFALNGAKVLDVTTSGMVVTGTLQSTGALTVSAGGITVTAGGISVVAGTCALQAITGTTYAGTDSIKTTSGNGIGYATGAGSTVTQITSMSTAVTINAICGQITCFPDALSTGNNVVFTVNNNKVEASDVIVVNQSTAPNAGRILVGVERVASGAFDIHVYCTSTVTQTIKINFAVIKAVTS